MAILTLFLLYRFALPAIGSAVAMMIPVTWEDALGREMVQRFAPPDKRCADANLQSAVDHIVRLLSGPTSSRYQYQLYVMPNEQVNAFAAPGGHIVVFTGLIKRTKTPEELAGVIAHEMEHAENRHGTRAIFRSLSFWALVSLVTGDANATIVQLAGTLVQLRYSRDDEAEADRGAMERMQQARLDPDGMIRAFRMLEREAADLPRGLQYLSTHPQLADRIRAVERLGRSSTAVREPLLQDRAWPPVLSCTQ